MDRRSCSENKEGLIALINLYCVNVINVSCISPAVCRIGIFEILEWKFLMGVFRPRECCDATECSICCEEVIVDIVSPTSCHGVRAGGVACIAVESMLDKS